MEQGNQGFPQPPNQQEGLTAVLEQLNGVLRNLVQPPHNEPAPATHAQEAAPEVQMSPVASPPAGPLPPRSYRSLLPDFIKCNRYFDGAFGKPDEAEDWLAQIERSFRAFEVPEHLKIAYGTYMLTYNARIWWDSKSRELLPPITWETFKGEFLENFFPGSLRIQYSADFLNISQKGRNLEQYETEFSRLLQYAPESYKHSEELKRQVFIDGLDEDLRIKLEEFDLRNFRELVERARIVENTRKRKREVAEKRIIVFKGPLPNGTNSSTEIEVPEPSSESNEEKNMTTQEIQCWKCKKKHYPKQCPQLQSKCYLCGSPNHKIKDCPKKTDTTCFICTKTGHLAKTCPGRNNPHIKSSCSLRDKKNSYKNRSNKGRRRKERSRTSSPKT